MKPNLALVLWVLAAVVFVVAAVAVPTPWWSQERWVAGGLALLVGGLLAGAWWPR